MQKMVELCHNKSIDMLKLGCTLQTWSTFFYEFLPGQDFIRTKKKDKILLSKVRENMIGGLSIVFTQKAGVDENQIPKSTNFWKSILGKDGSQLYPNSLPERIPKGLFTRDEFDADLQRLNPCQNQSRMFVYLVKSFFLR